MLQGTLVGLESTSGSDVAVVAAFPLSFPVTLRYISGFENALMTSCQACSLHKVKRNKIDTHTHTRTQWNFQFFILFFMKTIRSRKNENNNVLFCITCCVIVCYLLITYIYNFFSQVFLNFSDESDENNVLITGFQLLDMDHVDFVV